MKKGFTLIELLVVVLIIGILAAIALPQYTKAVERSRISEAVQFLGDFATAQSIYYMQNNEFATALSGTTTGGKYLNDGDITLTAPSSSTWTISYPAAGKAVATRKSGMYGAATGGSTLQITVEPSGAIKKCYSAKSGTTGWDSLVSAAGYTATSGC